MNHDLPYRRMLSWQETSGGRGSWRRDARIWSVDHGAYTKGLNLSMVRLLLASMLLALGTGLQAQPQASNWLLGPNEEGKHIMLSFLPDTALIVELPSPNPDWRSHEAISSISSLSGELMYYSSNYCTYNSDHRELSNSNDLNKVGTTCGSSSMTNGVLLLPLPGDSSGRFHVLLTTKEDRNSADYAKLQWSLIDRTLDGGFGAIVDSVKGVNVWPFRIQEKLAAIKHANGRDWWVLARKGIVPDSAMLEIASSSFALALLTPQGMLEYPAQNVPLFLADQQGELSVSKDGTMLVEAYTPSGDRSNAILSLFSFDRCTGAVELMDSVSAASAGAFGFYGVAIDARKRRLYASSGDGVLRLYQFSIGDMVIDSIYEVFRFGPGFNAGGQLEVGPDENIYMVYKPGLVEHPLKEHLGVIRNPSSFGSACKFDTFGVALETSMSWYGLPPQPNYALGALEGSGCDTLGSTSSAEGPAPPAPWSLHPNPASDRAWMEGLPEGSSWVLMDVLGRPLRNGFARQGRASVELDGLARGLYLMIVQPPGGAPLVRRLMVSGR